MKLLKILCVFVLIAASSYGAVDEDWKVHAKLRRAKRANGVDGPREEWDQSFWINQGKKSVNDQVNDKVIKKKARNVILFLGDGMGMSTIAAARILMGQRQNKPGENEYLSFEKFPITGLVKTYCVDSQVADSACSATAYLGGVKGNDATVGVDANVRVDDCEAMNNENYHVKSILYKAIEEGKSAGFVTTTKVTHASPAGAYAHIANREWENDYMVNLTLGENATCHDIAYQLIMNRPGQDFKVILGGGRKQFLPESNGGYRIDKRNLIEEWKNQRKEEMKNYKYVTDKQGLHDAVKEGTEYLLGLFHDYHNEFHMLADNTVQPTLEEMTEAAIKTVEKDENGYFLFIEGGCIDTAHHESRPHLALDETIEFSKAIDKALQLTNEEETLIVVSADHSNVMTLSGYPSRGNDILGASDGWLDLEGRQTITLNYANGPGYRKTVIGENGQVQRVDITKEKDFINRDPTFRYLGLAPHKAVTHAGEDVAIYAHGPGQHLFTGVFEQNLIPYLLEYIMCFGNDDTMCTDNGLINTK